jgi:glyoxylase-like metal-dependent hydrolase (beta-lactamase superfamily II)
MEIAPGVYSIMQRKGIYVHAYLLDGGDGLTLIDTLHGTDAALILDELQRIGRSPKDIKHILLTHAHRAHLGGLARLKEASGAAVSCHAWEVDIVEGDRRGQNMSLKLQRPYRLWVYQLASRFGKHPPCTVDRLIEGGDRIGPVEAVYAPGHTPGHLCFYWPERKALFAGDALVNYPEFGPGWPAFMLNPKQNRDSLSRMSQLDLEVLGVGHGEPLRSGAGAKLRTLVGRLGGKL